MAARISFPARASAPLLMYITVPRRLQQRRRSGGREDQGEQDQEDGNTKGERRRGEEKEMSNYHLPIGQCYLCVGSIENSLETRQFVLGGLDGGVRRLEDEETSIDHQLAIQLLHLSLEVHLHVLHLEHSKSRTFAFMQKRKEREGGGRTREGRRSGKGRGGAVR
eukprot:516123-Hanusia_phi.AAC.1